ncbi:hypothetical protein D3C84_866370 [compost metagenome]
MRGFVLHADPAFGEARQAAHVGCGVEDDAILTIDARRGSDAGFAQQPQVGVACVMATVDPQNHRRMGIVCRTDGFPLLRPESLQGFLQPARVSGAHHRIVFQFGKQRFAFPLGAA